MGNDTELLTMKVAIPEVTRTYYQACSEIDVHSRRHQDGLNSKKMF